MRSRWIPIVILLVLGGAILASIISISIGEKGPAPPVEGADEAQRLYGGIEQSGDALGDPNAPVTISIFNDLQCTDCAEYHLATVPRLVEDYVRDGEATLELRHRPIGQTPTTAAAVAATAAGEQGFEWQYAQLVFANLDEVSSGRVDDKFLERVAAAIQAPTFDDRTWERDRLAPETEEIVEADDELGAELGVAAPSVVVDGLGGTRVLHEGPSVQQIERAVGAVGGG